MSEEYIIDRAAPGAADFNSAEKREALTAAAPELLALANLCVDVIGRRGGYTTVGLNVLLRQARAVLKKVEP